MNASNPLVAAIEKERNHAQKVRRDNADLRGMVALHEAAHAAVSYSYAPWGRIEIPFADPLQGRSRDSCLSDEQEAETFFAGSVMDRVTYGHGLMASHDFFDGMQVLVSAYGHTTAAAMAPVIMDRAEKKVLALLPNIQALAVQAILKGRLDSKDFLRAANRVGLKSEGVRPRKHTASAVDLSQFANTPQQLRSDLGRKTLKAAHDLLKHEWSRTNATGLWIPKCTGCGPTAGGVGCDKPLVDENTAHAALFSGWSRLIPSWAASP